MAAITTLFLSVLKSYDHVIVSDVVYGGTVRLLQQILSGLGIEASFVDTSQAENVRAALTLVARGEAVLGIVYLTDAKVDPRVKVIGTFPEGSHPPIVYPAALTKTASPGGKAFLDFLAGKEARAIFEKAGFSPR